MTGYGEFRGSTPALGRANGTILAQPASAAAPVWCAEVRSVNHRHLKLTLRIPDALMGLESRIEALVRERLQRGTVTLLVRTEGPQEGAVAPVNRAVLAAYLEAIAEVVPNLDRSQAVAGLLSAPGVLDKGASRGDAEGHWESVRAVVAGAIDQLDRMRRAEGAAMARDLAACCQRIAELVQQAFRRNPEVVVAYQTRLRERLTRLLAESGGVELDPASLAREVAIFADKCDIAEEITRLQSHTDQFLSMLERPESVGRQLEFLSQEMNREANTIGSKANDLEIARLVVELKTQIERIREVLQNVE